MIHARPDYNRIQDPALEDPSLLGEGSTPIGEDEPVFLLRAQDKNFIPMLVRYEALLREDPKCDPGMVTAVETQRCRAAAWQQVNGSKTPDLPKIRSV